jgi:uncharacterized protein YbaR (Trm112 family)
MALDKRLLEILCCPASKQPVAPLSATQLQSLNRAVEGGQLRGGDGAAVTRPYTAALMTRDGRTVYRIEDGIPVMLVEDSVGTSQIEGFPA